MNCCMKVVKTQPATRRGLAHASRHTMTTDPTTAPTSTGLDTGPALAAPPAAVSPPLAPPPPPPIASERAAPANAAEALDEMTEVIIGARGALLASIDGFALAQSESMPNEAAHAAMLAATIGLAHQLVRMGGGEQLRQLVVDHDGGLLLLWPIGDTRVLAMLTESTVDQTRLRQFVRARASLLTDGR
jgi:predicted regulator of Ras-like GTPase activity (Roadblock/LC7/MglB family)